MAKHTEFIVGERHSGRGYEKEPPRRYSALLQFAKGVCEACCSVAKGYHHARSSRQRQNNQHQSHHAHALRAQGSRADIVREDTSCILPSRIFARYHLRKGTSQAPCYLVFEDLDSVVSDNVRSFFLNEVDGLSSNDGILMVGSTNHLDQLDPGISKRPSRFDRKFLFANPNFEQRVQYCHFWQGKLKDNKDVNFPDSLCEAIAKITEDFSFAYIQEAFVAALLVLAYSKHDDDEEDIKTDGDEWEVLESNGLGMARLDLGRSDKSGDLEDELKDNVLWVELKKQIKLLREELDVGNG